MTKITQQISSLEKYIFLLENLNILHPYIYSNTFFVYFFQIFIHLFFIFPIFLMFQHNRLPPLAYLIKKRKKLQQLTK